MPSRLIAQTLWALIRVHRIASQGQMRGLRQYLGVRPELSAHSDASVRPADVQRIAAVVDNMCALFVRPSTCLHRSVVLARLLRRAGSRADVVLGLKGEPFQGHAWVEIDGVIINDDAERVREYTVLERL
jgi:hypothetical protein